MRIQKVLPILTYIELLTIEIDVDKSRSDCF